MAENIKEIRTNNCLVRIHIPNFTAEEKEDRRERYINATTRFLYQVEKKRKKVSSDGGC